MIQPPCYDVKTKTDCPNRQWCLQVGRSQCQKWVEYEESHQAELRRINQMKCTNGFLIESSRKRTDRVLKHHTKGKYRAHSD